MTTSNFFFVNNLLQESVKGMKMDGDWDLADVGNSEGFVMKNILPDFICKLVLLKVS